MSNSYNVTQSGLVAEGKIQIQGISLTSAGEAAELILYDNTQASGEKIIKLKAPATSSASFTLPLGIKFKTGIFATLSGTGAEAFIYIR